MSSHLGTLFRVGGIFIGLISFWITVSFLGVLFIASIFNIDIDLLSLFYLSLLILILRLFYPRFVFSFK